MSEPSPVVEHKGRRVLVVGTTSDYIDWIRRENPGRALFLTDPENRFAAGEPDPSIEEELLCPLDDEELVKKRLFEHLRAHRMQLDGVACFDCESMELAAVLATELSLEYPSLEAIRLCRDKYRTRQAWQRKGIRCPHARLVRSARDVSIFFTEIGRSCVVKPLSGSGSELVFRCSDRKECDRNATLVREGVAARKHDRMHRNGDGWFLVEECVDGIEYSCDFVVSEQGARILRLTRKLKGRKKMFGTIDGYALADFDQEGLAMEELERMLFDASCALGITHAICMVDFLVSRGEAVLLEITPRPGGDCLPFLLKRSGCLDVLTRTLDFAQGKNRTLSVWKCPGRFVALRLHADRPGIVDRLDDRLLKLDPRVLDVSLIRRAGHRVRMPPVDYDSWYLGHVIFRGVDGRELGIQAREIEKKFVLEMKDDGC